MTTDYTEQTTGYWQSLLPSDTEVPLHGPYRFGYPVRLPDGRILMLPIRRRVDQPERAAASLIANHASFEVVDALAWFMAEIARPLQPDVVIGMPTLGLTLAAPMARLLGHPNFVPLGYSRKFWYEDALSEPVTSITTPDRGRAVYLDPNLLPRLRGRRVILVDDTISTGATAAAATRLLVRVEADPVGLVFAMCQGRAWAARLESRRRERVHWVFRSPLMRITPGGWAVDEGA